MSPSSLIFVAVVAVWAAYLVVDTTRRREYLATARTVDRFSASMRVLQRRAVRRESAEAFEASTAPMRNSSSVALHRHPQVSRAATEARAAEAASKPVPTSQTGGTRALADRQRTASRLRLARTFAVVALVFVLATLATAVLAGFGLVSWILPVAGILLSTGMVVLMRRQAVLARSGRGRARRMTSSVSTRRVSRVTTTATAGSTADPVMKVEDSRVEVRPAATAMPVAQEYIPFDYAREVEPAIAAEAAVVARADERDPLFDQEGWDPVPVPPPTYTLKARAERPMPPPLEIEDDYVPVVEEWETTEDVYSRAAGQ